MKRLIYLFVIFMLTTNLLLGTHNRAGEIQVKQLGYLQYEAIIKTYTKASSVPADRDSLEICWGDGSCEWIMRDSFTLLNFDYKYNTYTFQHTYTSEGNYTISMTDPNRNGGILNLNPPHSDDIPFHIETTIEVSAWTSSPPEFLNPPTEFGFTGEPLYHNLAAIDFEGDSLVYELTVPLQSVGIPVPNYFYPNDIAPGPNNTLAVDQATGLITWDAPQIEGSYNLAIRVTEYRNGNILSTTIRDIQYNIETLDPIIPPNNDLPQNDFVAENGDYINFDFTIGENNSEEIRVRAFGLPFLVNNPASLDLPSDFVAAPIEGTFSWDVLEEHAALSPFNIVFRIDKKVDDHVYTIYHIVKIAVNGDPLKIDWLNNNLAFEIFPNPSPSDLIFIELPELVYSSLQINVYDDLGKLIFKNPTNSSGQTFPLDISTLQKGKYFIQIISDEKVGLKKLIVF